MFWSFNSSRPENRPQLFLNSQGFNLALKVKTFKLYLWISFNFWWFFTSFFKQFTVLKQMQTLGLVAFLNKYWFCNISQIWNCLILMEYLHDLVNCLNVCIVNLLSVCCNCWLTQDSWLWSLISLNILRKRYQLDGSPKNIVLFFVSNYSMNIIFGKCKCWF